MAVDGIENLALAKRKAARQAGATDRRSLPSNEEVEVALHSYLQLYQADEQALRLAHLRARALKMMQTLERFNPRLSGPVLEGTAGRYCDIDLHLFTDSPKDVELFILRTGFDYKQCQRSFFRGTAPAVIVSFLVSTEEVDFRISVFARDDLRLSLRNTSNGRPMRHAGVESVAAMQQRSSVVDGSS